jgi:hypothetical protein
MNRAGLVRLVFALALTAAACASFAQQPLEIIALRHRTAEQVLPALQPLLEPGGTLSGMRTQLFLRTSPANAADIKRALAAIDQPLRRLVVSVRLDESLERERRDIAVGGSVGRDGARVGVSAEDSRRGRNERVDQRIQVLEGGRAFIATGGSQPVVIQGTMALEERRSGFDVIPRVSGNQVQLEIAQQRPGQALMSSVSTRLGEWVELGSVAQAMAATGSRGTQMRQVWVKVEELAP